MPKCILQGFGDPEGGERVRYRREGYREAASRLHGGNGALDDIPYIVTTLLLSPFFFCIFSFFFLFWEGGRSPEIVKKCQKIKCAELKLLPFGIIENSWDALRLGIQPFWYFYHFCVLCFNDPKVNPEWPQSESRVTPK